MLVGASGALLFLCIPSLAQLQTLAPGPRKLTATEPTTQLTYVRIFSTEYLSPRTAHPTPPLADDTLHHACSHRAVHAQYCRQTSFRAPHPLWRRRRYRLLSSMAFHRSQRSLSARNTQDNRHHGLLRIHQGKARKAAMGVPHRSRRRTRYSPPAMGSRNLEDITYYLQFLRALPTLRLTIPDKPRSSTSPTL